MRQVRETNCMESVAYWRTPGRTQRLQRSVDFMSAAQVADFVLVARLERPEDNLQGSNLKKEGQSDTSGHHRNSSENFHYALIVRLREEY
jgi:hypothetical protein